MRLFRFIVIAANIGIIVWIVKETANSSGGDLVISVGIVLLFCANTYLVARQNTGRWWLSLYFKRKALEEQARIDAISRTN